MNSPYTDQFLKCPTTEENTLGRCYAAMDGAYHAIPCAVQGHPSRGMVHLIAACEPKLQLSRLVLRIPKKWNSEAVEDLRACLEGR